MRILQNELVRGQLLLDTQDIGKLKHAVVMFLELHVNALYIKFKRFILITRRQIHILIYKAARTSLIVK